MTFETNAIREYLKSGYDVYFKSNIQTAWMLRSSKLNPIFIEGITIPMYIDDSRWPIHEVVVKPYK